MLYMSTAGIRLHIYCFVLYTSVKQAVKYVLYQFITKNWAVVTVPCANNTRTGAILSSHQAVFRVTLINLYYTNL
jgi:hypothetical protein